jgi:hypothetical protein
MKNVLDTWVRSARSLQRPSRSGNARLLRDRGETPSALVIRNAMSVDIPALAQLHVTTWNDTYGLRTGQNGKISRRIPVA